MTINFKYIIIRSVPYYVYTSGRMQKQQSACSFLTTQVSTVGLESFSVSSNKLLSGQKSISGNVMNRSCHLGGTNTSKIAAVSVLRLIGYLHMPDIL